MRFWAYRYTSSKRRSKRPHERDGMHAAALLMRTFFAPLQKPSRSVSAYGLTSRGFMVNLLDICSAVMRCSRSCFPRRFQRWHHQGGTLYICPPALQKPSRSVCAYGLTSRGFMVNLLDICSAVMRCSRSCFPRRFQRWHHQGGTLYICPPALQKPSRSVSALRA